MEKYRVGRENLHRTVRVHQESALSPILFVIIIDGLIEEIRKDAHWATMFADDAEISYPKGMRLNEPAEKLITCV